MKRTALAFGAVLALLGGCAAPYGASGNYYGGGGYYEPDYYASQAIVPYGGYGGGYGGGYAAPYAGAGYGGGYGYAQGSPGVQYYAPYSGASYGQPNQQLGVPGSHQPSASSHPPY